MSTPPFPNAFIGKASFPTHAELRDALGSASTLWDQLVADLSAEEGINIQEWASSSKKSGWALRLKRKDRVIVYLAPCHDYFRASFALGDKAVVAARHSGLPQPVLMIIDEAKRYAEGTAVRIDVKTANDLAIVKKLAKIKLEN